GGDDVGALDPVQPLVEPEQVGAAEQDRRRAPVVQSAAAREPARGDPVEHTADEQVRRHQQDDRGWVDSHGPGILLPPPSARPCEATGGRRPADRRLATGIPNSGRINSSTVPPGGGIWRSTSFAPTTSSSARWPTRSRSTRNTAIRRSRPGASTTS